MYCYIRPDNKVGELFEQMPSSDRYHPDFIARIVEKADEATQGWAYDWETHVFSPPDPVPEPSPSPMTTEEMILDKLTELEYRQDLIELGLTQEGGAII